MGRETSRFADPHFKSLEKFTCGAIIPTMNDNLDKENLRCPHCGTHLNPEDRYCPLCGQAVEAPKPSAPKQPGYCAKCGFYKDDVNAPCPHCGYSPNQQNGYANYQSPNGGYRSADPDATKAIKGGFLGFLMGFFLGILGLILCLIFGDRACKKGCAITVGVTFAAEILLLIIIVSSGVLSAV